MRKIFITLLLIIPFLGLNTIDINKNNSEIQKETYYETKVSDNFANITAIHQQNTLKINYFLVISNEEIIVEELTVLISVDYINTSNNEVSSEYILNYSNSITQSQSTIYTFEQIVIYDVLLVNKIYIDLEINNKTYFVNTFTTGNVNQVFVAKPKQRNNLVINIILLSLVLSISLITLIIMIKIYKKLRIKRKNKKIKEEMSLFWY